MELDKSDGSYSVDQENDTSREGHELLAVSRVAAALSGLWDLDAILRVALNNVLNIMNGAVGGILLLDKETQTLSYRVHQGLSTTFVEQVRLKVGEGIAGGVAQTGKAILLEDISTDPRVAYSDLVSAEGLKAFISVPLRSKDRVLGVITVASRATRRFAKNDMYLLHAIGDQLGVAIDKAGLYERLRRARERYRQLARQTLLAHEEERKRLARELHDETSQALSGLALQLQALVTMAEKSGGDAEFINRLKMIQSLAVQVHKEINRLMADLRPTLLDTLGLIPAIRQYAEANLRHLGIDVSIDIKGAETRLPPEMEAGLYRFFQGAIGNIAKHSKAKKTGIILEYQNNEFWVQISDDGIGFDVSKITDIDESGRGRGVFSMKERIGLLGGTCRIESKPGHGTTIQAKVRLNWGTDDAEDKSSGSG